MTLQSYAFIHKVIDQSPEVGRIHPQSINSIRIMTLWYDEKVSVLSGVMRVVVGNSKVDNVSSGIHVVGTDKAGRLAYLKEGKSFDTHSTTGVLIPR